MVAAVHAGGVDPLPTGLQPRPRSDQAGRGARLQATPGSIFGALTEAGAEALTVRRLDELKFR
jgi:hypothetical protein